MQRMMLAAVQATDERLIAPRYLMRISAHLAFSPSAQKTLVAIHWMHLSESHLHKVLLPIKKTNNSMLFVTGRLQWQRRHVYK